MNPRRRALNKTRHPRYERSFFRILKDSVYFAYICRQINKLFTKALTVSVIFFILLSLCMTKTIFTYQFNAENTVTSISFLEENMSKIVCFFVVSVVWGFRSMRSVEEIVLPLT